MIGAIVATVLWVRDDQQCMRDAGDGETDLCHFGVVFGPIYGAVGGFIIGLAVAFVAGLLAEKYGRGSSSSS